MDMRNKIKIPGGGDSGSNAFRCNAGGIPARVGGGTLKKGGFEGGGRASSSYGQRGPGEGPQGSTRGTRTLGKQPVSMSSNGFRERK